MRYEHKFLVPALQPGERRIPRLRRADGSLALAEMRREDSDLVILT